MFPLDHAAANRPTNTAVSSRWQQQWTEAAAAAADGRAGANGRGGPEDSFRAAAAPVAEGAVVGSTGGEGGGRSSSSSNTVSAAAAQAAAAVVGNMVPSTGRSLAAGEDAVMGTAIPAAAAAAQMGPPARMSAPTATAAETRTPAGLLPRPAAAVPAATGRGKWPAGDAAIPVTGRVPRALGVEAADVAKGCDPVVLGATSTLQGLVEREVGGAVVAMGQLEGKRAELYRKPAAAGDGGEGGGSVPSGGAAAAGNGDREAAAGHGGEGGGCLPSGATAGGRWDRASASAAAVDSREEGEYFPSIAAAALQVGSRDGRSVTGASPAAPAASTSGASGIRPAAAAATMAASPAAQCQVPLPAAAASRAAHGAMLVKSVALDRPAAAAGDGGEGGGSLPGVVGAAGSRDDRAGPSPAAQEAMLVRNMAIDMQPGETCRPSVSSSISTYPILQPPCISDEHPQGCQRGAFPGSSHMRASNSTSCRSWRELYQQQHQYEHRRCCPKCGAARLLPVVYGFPSGALLSGMASKRLVLGGDHLIENCHVWACSEYDGCRSSFRFYPYGDVRRWLRDDREQAERDAAMRGGAGRRRGGGGGGQQGGEGQGEGGAGGGLEVPRYTYEL